jgi:TetR/AcrR family transcriptional regulator, transcriptional repressor for nem operon
LFEIDEYGYLTFTMARSREFEEIEVLEKAVKLFSRKGYNGISMQELVDGLGINRSSIYDSFGDKQELFTAALKYYRQANTAQMLKMIEESGDIKKTIQDIFEHVKEESLNEKNHEGCMMVNTAVELASHEKKIFSLVFDNMSVVQGSLAKAIKAAQARNEVSKKNTAEALANSILTAINGLRVAAKWGAEKKVFDDVMKVTMSLF